jgi:hypothetical protein
MPGPCQMPGSYADADMQSGMGASLCGGGIWVVPGRSRVAPGLRYNNTVEYQWSSDEEEKEWGLRTDFVEREAPPSASRLCISSSTSRLRHPAGSRTSSTRRMTSASSTTFVQHAGVVSPLLFLHLVGNCGRGVGRDRRGVIGRCGLCELDY